MASFTDIADVSPLQVLCIGWPAPTAADAAFGPLHWRHGATLDVAERTLEGEVAPHAMVIDASLLAQAPPHWAGLSTAARRCAVLVIASTPGRAECWSWLRAGVQDVLPRERADAAELSRAVALAVRRWQQQEDVRRAWSIDLDTGLPNRVQLMELLHQLCALREREPAPMALAVFRLGNLAGCDASLGAAAAPTLRRKLAVRLRAGLRSSDVVAALDADCFAVLLTRLDAPQDAQQVVGKLTRTLQAPLSFAGQPVLVDVSAGVALHPLHARRPEEVLSLALAAAGEQDPTGGGRDGPRGARGQAANDA